MSLSDRPYPAETPRELWTQQMDMYLGKEMFLILSLLPRLTLYCQIATSVHLYFATETPGGGEHTKSLFIYVFIQNTLECLLCVFD